MLKMKEGLCASFDVKVDESKYSFFLGLSGDGNKLHEKASDFARESEFGEAIVPLHCVIAPFSRIAGEIFPGTSSLYLKHTVESLSHTYYGDVLTYSCRIERIDSFTGILVLKTIVYNKTRRVLVASAEMTVRSRGLVFEVERSEGVEYWDSNDPGSVVFLGASSEIGVRMIYEMAKRGYKPIMVFRRMRDGIASLISRMEVERRRHEIISFDLEEDDIDALKSRLSEVDIVERVQGVVNLASAPIESGLDQHCKVGFIPYKEVVEYLEGRLVTRQDSFIANVSSQARLYKPNGWYEYSAAKAATDQYVMSKVSLNRRFGMKGYVLMPGMVNTAFSKKYGGEAVGLTAGEVGRSISRIIGNEDEGIYLIDEGVVSYTRFGWDVKIQRSERTDGGSGKQIVKKAEEEEIDEGIEGRVRDIVARLSKEEIAGKELGMMSLSTLSDWDSLFQLSLLSEVEREFSVSFTSQEISKLVSARLIIDNIEGKLSNGVRGQQNSDKEGRK